MKRVLIWTGTAAAVIAILAGSLVWYAYHSAEKAANKMYENIDAVKPVYVSKDTTVTKNTKPAETKPIKNMAPFTVLVLGVDQRANDRGRSDTIIVLTVNPAKNSILMFNIPRDTRTTIVGHGTVDKINHAYAFGGVPMSINTIENFIDYPIDYYVKVNMEGFSRLIDIVGGVEVDNPFAFDYIDHHFDQGHLQLNGDEALLYSRMRYDDPRGDFGRNTRQRDLLRGIMKNTMNISSITHVNSLLRELGDSVKTDITFKEMKSFVANYRPEINKIDTVEVQGKGQTINKIWYYIVDDKERERVHALIKEHLQNGD
ncbi:LCP family protein [Paenibacillus sp. MWE-103]|uniref:LCP family protein n=2 Tax=Paenibacillus artemisiicola TaxID=1172618 RepID=A0ABS3WHI9_9BACL|nr:LCP family protein [Paenibacillus artemisiicola]